MKQLTIDVEDSKYEFFRELVESFEFTRIISDKAKTKDRKKGAILKSIKTGLEEVEAIKSGKLKSIPLNELLDGL